MKTKFAVRHYIIDTSLGPWQLATHTQTHKQKEFQTYSPTAHTFTRETVVSKDLSNNSQPCWSGKCLKAETPARLDSSIRTIGWYSGLCLTIRSGH